MSDFSQKPRSDGPNVPQTSSWVYFAEKADFSGTLVGAFCYGVVIVLFLRCMAALLNPANRTNGGIEWGLIAHAAAMFSSVTIFTAANFNLQSISYINNREFSGVDIMSVPGPVGYQLLIYSKPTDVITYTMFLLGQWLADGLLLYRCYFVYGINHWIIAFPCLMYLTSLATGVTLVCHESSKSHSYLGSANVNLSGSYYAVAFSLNVLLTLMLGIRLALHSNSIWSTARISSGATGLYKVVITTIIESCLLYTVTFLLFIGGWAAGNPIQFFFFPILAEVQVIAPLLIDLQVTNWTSGTDDVIASGNAGSICFRSREETVTFPGVNPENLTELNGETPCGFNARIEVSNDGPSLSQGLKRPG